MQSGSAYQPELSKQILQQSQRRTFPYVVEILGKRFIVMRDVFSPDYFESTAIFTRWICSADRGRFLEVGCGIGATGVDAVATGAATSALLLDINPNAVRNAACNARLHGRQSVIRCRVSDVLSTVSPYEEFDTIYWNTPFILRDRAFRFSGVLERALFDPGYGAHERFLNQSRRHLAPEGKLLIGFGNFGDERRLRALVHKHGWKIDSVQRKSAHEGAPIEFQLYTCVRG